MAGIVPHFQARHFVVIPLIAFTAMLFPVTPPGLQADTTYYPSRDNWERRKPADLGMDENMLAQAVQWARKQETNWPLDFSNQTSAFGRQLGPIPARRGQVNGLVLRKGYIVAEFGDTASVRGKSSKVL